MEANQTIMRYDYTTIRKAKIKKKTQNNLTLSNSGHAANQQELTLFACGSKNCTAVLEDGEFDILELEIRQFLPNLNTVLPHNMAIMSLGIYSMS